MPTFTQADRPLAIYTPLGDDVLLVTAFRASEGISRLYRYETDLIAETGTAVPFDRLLGAGMTVELRPPDGPTRYFDGLVKCFSQGERTEVFTRYRAELVPRLWLLTKIVRSRIFQQMTVPDILRQVFSRLQVSYELAGQYHPRDYCVQYHESDFDFASRLMEEEGIYYFFQHSRGNHQLIVTDIAHQHPTVPGPASVVFEEVAGEVRGDMRITRWEKKQELRSGQYTLRDYCFEMPSTRLEAHAQTDDSITIGKVVHKLRVGGNDELEIYDYPGCYAQRFDGIAPHGGVRAQDLTQVFPDGDRTAKLRMEREQAAGVEIRGESDCGHFIPGHKFTLERHFDGDGAYLLNEVEHEAGQAGYLSGEEFAFRYQNRFACIPADLRYRPPRETPKPQIAGVQTATVVGPEGQQVFCDKYGRVKVQFHWDRDGKKNADSSCWLRVAQFWAGNRWGAFFWPRIGHEVVVAFEDGDPDRPIVVGSVYNAENMPPMPLPATNLLCGIKSSSLRGKVNENFNGITFVDVKGKEHLALHSERHMALVAEYDVAAQNGRHHFQRVPGAHMTSVGSLPGTGGSGGSPAKNPDGPGAPSAGGSGGSVTLGTPGGTPWAVPQPTSSVGLSSTVVYGSAFQSSWPISLQLANNSLIQIVLDVAGFTQSYPSAGAPMAAASFGLCEGVLGATGNMQVTLGNSATITMGRGYDIHIGPEATQVHVNDKTGDTILSPILGGILGMIAIIFQEAYALMGASSSSQINDDLRGVLVWAFQTAVQIVLWHLLSSSVSWKIDDLMGKHVVNTANGVQGVQLTAEQQAAVADLTALQAGPLSVPEMIEGLVLPTLLASLGEADLAGSDNLPS